MYQVLYRKWRPKSFSDVSGQEHITRTLRNEIAGGKISHAYLFTGCRGTGKTTCAKIFAKAVNCPNSKDGEPCNECEICKGIDNATIMDVEEIDAASNTGVDNIREIRDEVNFTPSAASYRVYIIDEVHMLSDGAFNALLKTLEEPPAHVIFILATTEVHKIPATILSRCQRFDFNRIKPEDISARLKYVAENEQMELDDEAALLIARLADGALRDALSILDRCADGGRITTERVGEVAGLAGRDSLFEMSDAIAGNNLVAALKCIETLNGSSRDMSLLCSQLVSHFRNIMLASVVPNPVDFIIAPPDEIQKYMNTAAKIPLDRILAVLDALQSAYERMRTAGSKRVELEMTVIRLMNGDSNTNNSAANIQPQKAAENPAFTHRPIPVQPTEKQSIHMADEAAEKYRQPLTEQAPDTNESVPDDAPPWDMEPPPEQEANENKPKPEPVKFNAPAVKQQPVSNENTSGLPVFTKWPEAIAALSQKNRLMASVLKGSDAYEKGELLLIRCNNPMFLDLIRDSSGKNRNDIRDSVAAVSGRQFRLGPYKPEEEKKETDPVQAFVADMRSRGVNIQTNSGKDE